MCALRSSLVPSRIAALVDSLSATCCVTSHSGARCRAQMLHEENDELHRTVAASITPERKLAPDTLAAMHQAWDDIVAAVEGRHWRQDVAKGIFRKIVGRSLPSDHEVHNVMGIFGNVLKRFDHPDWRTEESSRTLRERGLIATPVDEEE